MAHELDQTTGRTAMAYIATSATPWHGLGQRVNPDSSVEEWREAAGLNWQAMRAQVQYENDHLGQLCAFADKHVLYRSDTHAPISVVSSGYQIVQPDSVLEFFKVLAETGQFSIETVGAIKAGRRIWALARVGENAKILDDEVAPYLLLATSYDGTMATVAKFTTIRVVCNNTLQASLRNASGRAQVTVPHSAIFDAKSIRSDLGIALDSWDEFMIRAKRLANRKISDAEMDAFLLELIEPPYGKSYTPEQVRNGKGYQRIVALFHGGQMGAGQDAINGTAWGALQACTQYVDHEKGRLQDNRIDNAWFGPGDRLKSKAMEILERVAA